MCVCVCKYRYYMYMYMYMCIYIYIINIRECLMCRVDSKYSCMNMCTYIHTKVSSFFPYFTHTHTYSTVHRASSSATESERD